MTAFRQRLRAMSPTTRRILGILCLAPVVGILFGAGAMSGYALMDVVVQWRAAARISAVATDDSLRHLQAVRND